MKNITVIDLGTNKIAALTAKLSKDGTVSIEAMESLNSRGMRAGEIKDINRTVEDISLVVKRLERHKKRKIKSAFITTKSPDIEFVLSRGMVPLSNASREITKKDIGKCLQIAGMMKIPLERAVLQKLVKGFRIDDGSLFPGNPEGLYGVKLETEAFIVTAKQSNINNIAKCMDHAGLLLDGIFISSIALADCVLEDREKEKGVLLLDIGDSLTEGLIFKNSLLVYFFNVKKGADFLLDREEEVNKGNLSVFLDEINKNVQEVTEKFEHLVIAGGGALIDGLLEEAEKKLICPARIGIAKDAGRSLNSQDGIIHASTIGLAERIAKDYKASQPYRNPVSSAIHKALHIYEMYF